MIDLEERGVPTVVICTTAFVGLGKSIARSLGLEQGALAVVSHPIGGLKPDEVRRRAEEALPQVARLLARAAGP